MVESRFLTFLANGERYALPAEKVAEVIRLPDVARVPQAPIGLLGLANLRGDILPVASLRGLLGRPEAAAISSGNRAIVLEGVAPVALAVDSVETLVTIADDKIETRQTELATRSGERLLGSFAVGDGAAVARIIDVAALIAAAFVQADRPAVRRSMQAPSLEEETATGAEGGRRLVTFDVAGQEYAFELDDVREVLDAPGSIATLPATEDLVLGMMPFRDTLLPLLSLRGLLGFETDAQRTGREKIVVIGVGGALVGLVADRILTVISADSALIEAIPPVLSARTGGECKVSAIYRGDGGRRLVSLLSPERLFREDVMNRLRANGSVSGTGEKAIVPGGEERQFVVFRLGAEEFGLPIEAVNEVARVPDQITRLPRTPKFIEGVVNIRGDVVPVVDQRRRFDMPPCEDPGSRRLMVVKTERHRAGLIVDSVVEVLRCFADEIGPAPMLANETVRLVQGVVNLEKAGRIVLLLDPAELLTRAERSLLDAFHAKSERARA